MQRRYVIGLLAAILAVVLVGVGIYVSTKKPAAVSQVAQPHTGTRVHYLCEEGKTIDATYYADESATTTPAREDVDVTLSSGQNLSFKQTRSSSPWSIYTVSGMPLPVSGMSTALFRNGNAARLLDGERYTYFGCVALAPQAAGTALSQSYVNSEYGFSVRLPAGYTADASYSYTLDGTPYLSRGVKFTIPSAMASGTTLSSDTYLSVEYVADPTRYQGCHASFFLDHPGNLGPVTENGKTYSKGSVVRNTATERTENTVYALPDSVPCTAIRYVVRHYVPKQQAADTRAPFDDATLAKTFDAIRDSVVTAPPEGSQAHDLNY